MARTFRQMPLLLAPTLQNLSSLEIAIVSGYWTFTTGKWDRKSLASLLSLVNGLAPTLEELSIAPPAPYDLTPLFEGLGGRERPNFGVAANSLIFTGHFPHLRHLSVREPIDGIHMSDVAVFQKFVDSHRGTLKGLTLGADTHSNFDYSETSWVPRLFEPMSGNELIQICRTIVRVGIVRIGGLEIIRHSGQARVLGDQVEQRDLDTRRLGDRAGRQQLSHGLIQLDAALLHHLREHETGEGLGD